MQALLQRLGMIIRTRFLLQTIYKKEFSRKNLTLAQPSELKKIFPFLPSFVRPVVDLIQRSPCIKKSVCCFFLNARRQAAITYRD